MYYATTYILHLVELHLYIDCWKAFGEHREIQIAMYMYHEMKRKIYFISSF